MAATQLAVLEACLRRLEQPIPILIHDPLTALEAPGRGVFQQMLSALADQKAQIFVVTPADDLGGNAVRW
jgi:hypothetical protein